MNKMFLKIGFGMLALVGVAWPSSGAVAGMKTLSGHVPSVVSLLAPVSRLSGTNQLHLAIGLSLRNQDQLKLLLQQVSDPTSSHYHQYLTPDEFATQFGPTADDAQSVINFALTNGLSLRRLHGNRMLVEVTGSASNIEHAFNVKFHTYHLAGNRDFYAPDQEPSVAAGLPILDVQGLNNYVQPRPKLHLGPLNASAHLGSGPSGTYIGNDFRAAYVPGTTLNGSGQKVALVEFDGYLASDIAAYEQQAGYSTVALTNILLQGSSGVPFDPDFQGEVTLDIDMVIAMAPAISQVEVYEGNPQAAFLPNLVLNQIAVDDSASQVSSSWGWSGGPSTTTDQIFEQMILQGQAFFNASGDSCAYLPPGSPGSVDDPTLPNAPSDDPFITQVGATTLQTTAPGGAYLSESVWNWGVEFPGQGFDGVGSSGGISGYYAIPSWQQGINMATNGGSTTARNLPDVAMPGDNIFIIVNGVAELGVGGTSCAAPLWAAFTALVNEQGASQGLKPVGFINPLIYSLAKTAAYTNLFHDVVNGNNTWSASPTNFYAVPGYDLCSGLGSPNGTNLINALTGTNVNTIVYAPIIPAPKQPWGNTLGVMNGSNPNGIWLLFIQDDGNQYGGTNYNGWFINLTTANPVGSAADDELTISTTNVSISSGSQWIATLTVTNYGPSLSQGVFVSDTLPISPGITLISSNSSISSSSVTLLGSTLTWTLGNLAANSGGTLALTFQANAVGNYTNGATVGAVTTDPNSDNNSVGFSAVVVNSTPPVIVPGLGFGAHGGFQLSITNDSGSSVVIQASTNLTTWLPVFTNVAPFTFTNLDSTNYPQRFYRAIVGQ